MLITLQTPDPHSWEQRVLMEAFHTKGLLELWVACGTKFGKTIGGEAGLVSKAAITPAMIFRHIAPIYSQTKIGMRYAEKMLPGKPYTNINRSGLPTISFPSLQTTIEYWHGQNPEDLEGEGTAANLIDEAAKQKRQVYDSTKTTTTVTKGLIVGISTPRGKGWFYERCMFAKDHMAWAKKKGVPPKYVFITAPSYANPAVTEDTIGEFKRTFPERLYLQYIEAQFVDDGDVFSNFRKAIYGPELIFDSDTQFWTNKEYEHLVGDTWKVSVVMGVDWGKKDDYTVMTVWDYQRQRMIGFLRFRGLDYIAAIKNLIWLASKYSDVQMIYHDKTGLGEVMDDALGKTGLPYEGIVFTNRSKADMVNALIVAFQKGEIQIPYWSDMIKELDAYEVTTTVIGNMRYSAPEGSGIHDDIVSSMFLGWAAVEEYRTESFDIKVMESLPDQNPLSVENWLRDMEDDIEDNDPSWKAVK